MRRLIDMLMRVGFTGAFGAVLGYVLTMAYELLFQGGALTFQSPSAVSGGVIGFVIGAAIGFFKKH